MQPVDFQTLLVDPSDWETHWRNRDTLIADMKKAQDPALRLRERIQQAINDVEQRLAP